MKVIALIGEEGLKARDGKTQGSNMDSWEWAPSAEIREFGRRREEEGQQKGNRRK